MQIFRRTPKENREGHYFFGKYHETDLGISYVTIDDPSHVYIDQEHYHQEAYEYYMVLKGSAQIYISGELIQISSKKVIMIEPGEHHYITQVLEYPFQMIVMTTVRDHKDKVLVKKKKVF